MCSSPVTPTGTSRSAVSKTKTLGIRHSGQRKPDRDGRSIPAMSSNPAQQVKVVFSSWTVAVDQRDLAVFATKRRHGSRGQHVTAGQHLAK